jgi:3',5'-cyclic-AMP phosphodiesterase
VIVQLSDLHLGPSGATDPLEDAREAIRALRALRPEPDALLLSGDLAEHAEASEYGLVRDLLEGLSVPSHVLCGNHDDRDVLREAFPVPGGTGDRYRWAAQLGGIRVVACDSTIPGRDDGELDAAELGWLREQLAVDPATPTIVAMHHTPVDTGIPGLDAVGLPAGDRAALADLLTGFPQVRRIVSGHIHMGMAAELGPTPVVTCPSTWRYRPALELGADEAPFIELPAGMLVHALVGGRLASRVHPV